MPKAKKQEEPTLRDQLLSDYAEKERNIEDAASVELWELADWLAEYVPDGPNGRPSGNRAAGFAVTISDLAAEGYRTKRWLQELRRVAKITEAGRLADVSPSTYRDVLQKHSGNLAAANADLRKKGNKRRDHRSGEGVKGIIKALEQKSPEDQQEVARAIYRKIGPVTVTDDEPEDDIDEPDNEEDTEPEPIDPSASQTLRESYASCVTSTVEQHIDAIEGALKYLFETDMYKIGKADRTRLRTILKKGIKALDD